MSKRKLRAKIAQLQLELKELKVQERAMRCGFLQMIREVQKLNNRRSSQ